VARYRQERESRSGRFQPSIFGPKYWLNREEICAATNVVSLFHGRSTLTNPSDGLLRLQPLSIVVGCGRENDIRENKVHYFGLSDFGFFSFSRSSTICWPPATVGPRPRIHPTIAGGHNNPGSWNPSIIFSWQPTYGYLWAVCNEGEYCGEDSIFRVFPLDIYS